MSSRSPTIQQMLTAVKDVDNWFLFGVFLKVPVPKLKKIKSCHNNEPELCKIDTLQYWLDNKLVPKWEDVIRALEQCDQYFLAAQVKQEHLLSSTDDKVSSVPLLTVDEIETEIRADVTVVSNLKKLEDSFGCMIVRVKRHLEQCNLSEAKLFLVSATGTKAFRECENFGELLEQLQQNYIDVFNISILQQLITACFDKHDQIDEIKTYIETKERFLKKITVLEFQRAVVSRVKPILVSGKAVVTITISKDMAYDRTLKDIEKLAMEGFEEDHKQFIRLHAVRGSIIISWVFPSELSSRIEKLALDNATVFKNNGVLEVTVGGKRVFPCTQQEDMATHSLQGASHSDREEKSKLKLLYIEFYHQLVEAVSDPDTCHSLTAQLHSSSLLSEEKKTVLSSSQASGSSFLKVLGVEEEPHLVTVLMEKMSAVKKLQTLSEDMSAWLSGSKQGASDSEPTEKQAHYERIERQQILAENERLTSDKTDLLKRLQCYEKDLKAANELLRMREKAIAGMMSAQSRYTDAEERERILKEEVEDLRTERQLLSIEVEELTSELTTKSDKLNMAMKSNAELLSLKLKELPPNLHPYPMSKSPHGLCLIINNKYFMEKCKREGSEVDEKSVSKLFCDTLGYKLHKGEAHQNLIAKDMVSLVKEVAEADHSRYDSVVLFLASHGDSYFLYGSDNRLVSIEQIEEILTDSKSLVGKPKIIFIQVSQGSELPDGREVQEDDENLFIPRGSDFFIGYATTPNTKACRFTNAGSWYVIELCKMLENYHAHTDLHRMVTAVHNELATNKEYVYEFTRKSTGKLVQYKQVPQLISTLTRPVYFKMDS